MTWTAAGSALTASGTTSTLSMTMSNQAAGNLLLVEVIGHETGTWATGISGGGATWAQIGSKFTGAVNTRTATVWAGTVTATGAGTATITMNTTPTGTVHCAGHEFHSTVGSWVLDGSQGNLDSAGTGTWTSLTPGTAGDLYWGYAVNSGNATAGSTTGFLGNYTVDSSGNGMTYDLSCALGTPAAPVWGDSTELFGTMVLIAEQVTAVSANAGLPQPAAAGQDPAGQIAGTPVLYPTGYAVISGTWTDQGNVTGAPDGLCAVWDGTGPGETAVLELAYGSTLQDALLPGSTVTDVQVQIWHGETPSALIASATAQAYPAGAPSGSGHALSVGDTVHGDLVVFTGLAYADLADFRVRVTITRN